MEDENSKSEPMDMSMTEVPTYTPELGTRISIAIERAGGVRAAAKFTGATEDTLANWRDGKSRPSFFGMQGLANAAKIRLEWLANGEDPMERNNSSALAKPTYEGPATDARLMGRLVEKILLVYKEMGVAIPHHQAGERAAEEHNRIVATVSDPVERLILVGEVAERLRQELRSATAAPASSKRRA